MKPKKSNNSIWIVLGLLLFLGIGILGLMGIVVAVSDPLPAGRIGLVEYSGIITDQGSASMLGLSTGGARDFIKELQRASDDKSVKAIVIRINSPGGSPSASQEMYQAIRRVRQVKPVVCSMGDAAASGGYYTAAACDKIYANASTITGSIGVISQSLNFSQLLNKFGVQDATQKSGRYKDMGNPYKPVDPAHIKYEQALINDIYQQFVNDVLAGRKNKLTRAQLLKLADGRVYTGAQAKKNGLIDELGGLYEAIEAAGKLGGLNGKPAVKNFSSGGLFGSSFDTEANSSSAFESAAMRAGNTFAATAGRAFAETMVQRLKAESSTPSLPQLR